MIKTMPLSHDFSIFVENTPSLWGNLESKINELWAQFREPHMFDSPIAILLNHSPSRLVVSFINYRFLWAQTRYPECFSVGRIFPLSVSGILFCPEGIVLGKRQASVLQYPEYWECIPSGGLSVECFQNPNLLSAQKQLELELLEEGGIYEIEYLLSQALCYDPLTCTYDIVLLVKTDLSFADILFKFHNLTNKEYQNLSVVRLNEVDNFISSHQCLPLSIHLLKQFCAKI